MYLLSAGRSDLRLLSGDAFSVFSTVQHEFFLSCYEIEHPMANNRKECQYFSKQNLFTDSRQSGAKKARSGALFNPRQMEKRGGKARFLHTCYGFVHVFSLFLVPFRGFVSTPKNKTATPNFFLALTFSSQRCPFFAKSSPSG